jgi:pyruvate/2-oxoacid:ferredoxin oxidoreductase alpha subunit
MILKKEKAQLDAPKYPGIRTAYDGSEAVVAMETAGSEGAGAYPITPSTQMGEGWAAAVAAGKLNVHGRKLIFFEPEGEHAAAAVTAGMSMTGLRATNFSSGQGIAYMHESLYAAVGKRLTYILNIACRAMTKHALNVHAGHDDYHCIDDTGFFLVFGKNVQEVADLNLISHRIAELTLNPGACAQDGFLTSHVIESMMLAERELIKEYLGDPSDIIESVTPAQRMVFGETRRRIPEMFDLDYPAMIGVVQNQDSYAQGVAAQRPFFFDHIQELTDQAMDEFYQLTGRRYNRASGYRLDDAEYVIVGQGSVVWNARRSEPDDVPAVPGGSDREAAERQEGGRDPRADRPAARRGSADRSRSSCRHGESRGERSLEERRSAPCGPSGSQAGRRAAVLLRRLRDGKPRPAAGRSDRCGGQHATGRPQAAPVLPGHRFHPQRYSPAEAADLAGQAPRVVPGSL